MLLSNFSKKVLKLRQFTGFYIVISRVFGKYRDYIKLGPAGKSVLKKTKRYSGLFQASMIDSNWSGRFIGEKKVIRKVARKKRAK